MTDEWRDVDRLLTKLPIDIAGKVVDKAERKAAWIIARRARKLVPVDTGLLKRSIGVARAKPSDTPKNATRFYIMPKTRVKFTKSVLVDGQKGKARITTRSYHGHLVEYGTAKMSAHPYLHPAATQTTTQVVTTFQGEIRKGVDRWR